MENLRLNITRRLSERLMELEPERFLPLPDAKLAAAGNAYISALITLGKYGHTTDISHQTRTNLITALLAGLSDN